MRRLPLATGGFLVLTSGACASGGAGDGGSLRSPSRHIPVYETSGPTCPHTPLGEVYAEDRPGFEFLSVQEQAKRRNADAVINAVFDPTRGGRGYYVSGTAIRWADPECP